MSGSRVFFDTSFLVSCFDGVDQRKRSIARELVMEAGAAARGVISYQVRQEFVAVAIRKIQGKQEVGQCLEGMSFLAIGLHTVHSSDLLLQRAVSLWEAHPFSWYDSLIVAAALQARCAYLFSEDLPHGLAIDGMRIIDPFRR